MADVARIRSTFAPRVCIGCHWEAKYNRLKRLHATLRANLMKANGGKRVRVEREDEDRGDALDLVDMMRVHE